MRVLTLQETDGLPVVEGAALIKEEAGSGWVSVHFAPVDKLWVMLFMVAPGKYLAIPNSPEAAAEMPNAPSVSWERYRKRPAVRRKWRFWVGRGTTFARRRLSMTKDAPARDIPDEGGERAFPRTIGDTDVEWATMTLPSVCGQSSTFLADEIEEVEE